MSHTRTIDGPVGLVGAGYIGHLFAQQFAIAGYDVRAWSPGESAATLSDRLPEPVDAGRDRRRGALPGDAAVARVSAHDDLGAALTPCEAVMESIVEDAEAKSACYGDIEAASRPDALLWSSTSNFPMTRLAAGMAHPSSSTRWSGPLWVPSSRCSGHCR